MQPVSFPEQTFVLGEHQKQYLPLPAFAQVVNQGMPDEHVQYTCKYEFSDIEIAQIVKTKCAYISQFGMGFHPIYPQVESPFYQVPVEYIQLDSGDWRAWVPVSDGSVFECISNTAEGIIDVILNRFKELKPEHIYFTPRRLVIDADGNLKSDI